MERNVPPFFPRGHQQNDPAWPGSTGELHLVAAYNRAMEEGRYDDGTAILRECARGAEPS